MDPLSPLFRTAEEAERHSIVARLRERYGEARELVSSAEPFGNLEWILGARRNRTRDESDFDLRTAELVVLWLEDLSWNLDSPGLRSHPGAGDVAPSSAASRQSVVQNLRVATREFAAAFLGPQPASSP
jgi:hypothetical protein